MIPRRFGTYSGWRRAASEMGATRFGGDKDHAFAWASNGNSVGEWDGAEGFVVGVLRGQSRAGRMLLRGGMPGEDTMARGNPRYEPPHDAKVQRVAERAGVPYSRVRRVAMEGPGQWFAVVGRSGMLYHMDPNGFIREERSGPKPGWDDASSASMGNPVKDLSRWRPRIGEMVMGIMGVEGGYAGRVTNIKGSGDRAVVTYVDDDGVVHETLALNLTPNVPERGRFPRLNPDRRSGIDDLIQKVACTLSDEGASMSTTQQIVINNDGIEYTFVFGKTLMTYFYGEPGENKVQGRSSLGLSNVDARTIASYIRRVIKTHAKHGGKLMPKHNPSTRSGMSNEHARNALVELGSFVARMPDDEWGSDEVSWIADKAIQLGIAKVVRGSFSPSATALDVVPTNRYMKAGRDALRIMQAPDWDSDVIGELQAVSADVRGGETMTPEEA